MQDNVRISIIKHPTAVLRPGHDLELLHAPCLGANTLTRGLPCDFLVPRMLMDTLLELCHHNSYECDGNENDQHKSHIRPEQRNVRVFDIISLRFFQMRHVIIKYFCF